jgi:hypothetical protein
VLEAATLCAQVWKALHMTVLTSPLKDMVDLGRVELHTRAAHYSCTLELHTTAAHYSCTLQLPTTDY